VFVLISLLGLLGCTCNSTTSTGGQGRGDEGSEVGVKVLKVPPPADAPPMATTETRTDYSFTFKDRTIKDDGVNPAFVQCLKEYCAESDTQRDFFECRQKVCKKKGGSLSLAADGLTYDGKVLKLGAKGDWKPAVFGMYTGAPTPVWVGLTVHAGGKEIDVAPVETTTGALTPDKPVAFEVPVEGATGYTLAVWEKKVDCKDGRDGCTKFGVSFKDDLVTVPENAYRRGERIAPIPK
jgi:hypothetical protein